MPPDFLFMANKRPPKKNGDTSFGHRPAKTTFVKPVRAAKKYYYYYCRPTTALFLFL